MSAGLPDRRLCVIVAKTWWVDLRSGETVTACGGGGLCVSRLSESPWRRGGVYVCHFELRLLPRAAAGSGGGVWRPSTKMAIQGYAHAAARYSSGCGSATASKCPQQL